MHVTCKIDPKGVITFLVLEHAKWMSMCLVYFFLSWTCQLRTYMTVTIFSSNGTLRYYFFRLDHILVTKKISWAV